MAILELPVRGWKPAFFEENDRAWAFAVDYPLNARTVLRSHGVRFDEPAVLLTLCRELSAAPERYLKDLAPPFSLIWCDKASGEVRFQNDGLGQAQAFDCRGDGFRVLTNKIHALEALGIEPVPDTGQWAVRLTLGWFPLDTTGYRGVRFVGPGTHVRFDRDRVATASHDVLREWVNPPSLSKQDCLDLGREAMLAMAREAVTLWKKPSVGLSGGWDSRTVVAALRHIGAEFSARVRGHPERYDVMIANELARISGFPLRTKFSSGMPPQTTDSLRAGMGRALLWQAGGIPTEKHKLFLARKQHLDGGTVNVMGQHGGLGKADYAVKIRADTLAPSEYEKRLLLELRRKEPPLIRAELSEHIQAVILEAYRAADGYGLDGLARLHFLYLNEYTRRWSSGSLAGQSGVVWAPFLCPDFIRACYAYPPGELPHKPFHRYITDSLAPEWKAVPYTDESTRRSLDMAGIRAVGVESSQRQRIEGAIAARGLRPGGKKNYDFRSYWLRVGKPIIDEAIENGGFWTTVFDPDAVKTGWVKGADELAIAHLADAGLGAARPGTVFGPGGKPFTQ